MSVLKLIASSILSVTALALDEPCQPTGAQCIRGVPCCNGACDVHGWYCEGGSHGNPPTQCLQPGMRCSGERIPCCFGSHCEGGVCTLGGYQNCAPEEDICSLWGLSGKPCCAGMSCEQSSRPTIRVCKRADPYSCAGPGQMCQWDGVSVTRRCCDGSACDLRTTLGHACNIPRSCGNSGDECRWLVSGYTRQCCAGQVCSLQGLRYKCAWHNLQSSSNISSIDFANATEEDAWDIDASESLP